jgi:hypothetical protein
LAEDQPVARPHVDCTDKRNKITFITPVALSCFNVMYLVQSSCSFLFLFRSKKMNVAADWRTLPNWYFSPNIESLMLADETGRTCKSHVQNDRQVQIFSWKT